MPSESRDHNPGAVRPHAPPPRFARGVDPFDAAGLLARGAAMGAADVVPGVSGGTIALITGVYERFIAALRSLTFAWLPPLLKGRLGEAAGILALRIHWGVLLPLGVGILGAIVVMSRILPALMERHPGPTFAFFFGLILASVWIPFARMGVRRPMHIAAAAVAAGLAFLFVGLQPAGPRLEAVEIAGAPGATREVVYLNKVRHAGDERRVIDAAQRIGAERFGERATFSVVLFDPRELVEPGAWGATVVAITDEEALRAALASPANRVGLREASPNLAWLFFCGTIAICAMLLPGVSGAFLLLLLGQYQFVLTSIRGVIDGALSVVGRDAGPFAAIGAAPWWSDALHLGVFALGALVGLVSFSRVVHWLLEHRHDLTMAALTGLMVGGLRQPGAETLRASLGQAPTSFWAPALACAALGAALVLALWFVERRFASRARAS